MLPKSKQRRFFKAIRSGNIQQVENIISSISSKNLLQQKITKAKENMRSSKLTYGEKAINLAIKHNQLNMIKYLHKAGCTIGTHHLESALPLLKKYPIKQVSELFTYLLDNGANINTLIQQAVTNDNEQMINDIAQLKWSYIEEFREEKTSTDLVDFAAKHQAAHILKNLVNRKESENKLRDKIRENKSQCRNKFKLPILPLEQSDLSDQYEVSPKGLALLLEYYHQKKTTAKQDHKVYFAIGLENLVHCLDLFAKSTEKDLTLLHAYTTYHEEMGGHRYTFRFEKYNDKIYVMLMDSFSNESHKSIYHLEDLINQIILTVPSILPKLVICTNLTNQQTDMSNCSHFAVKNISKLLTTPSLAKEIEDYHVIKRQKHKEIDIIFYRLPARFMNLAQSYNGLKTYIETNTSEDLQAIRTNKENKVESLEKYAYHNREGYGITTPDRRENRDYKENNGEPKYIPDNLSIDYFAQKHKQYVIPTLFTKLTDNTEKNEYQKQARLREVINGRDASQLTLTSRSKKLVVPTLEEVHEPVLKKLKT